MPRRAGGGGRAAASHLLFFDAARRTRQTGAMDAIRHYFLAQLAEQEAEAARHLGDGYWTNGRTGRNVGLDELQAIAAMKTIALDPRPDDEDAHIYLSRLLADLDGVANRFRAAAPDPDGYGIATIGTVARRLAAFGLSARCRSAP
ncbi:hypothetical protein [Sphingopyxis sp. GC21]|uniref:hypothetical protein n=1 Tax=Sphingopyxis sp. GC21 TaxID=2933562 RepID=UPI0021E4C0DD|nr:hypothetical protein [Sphingopyxis sp. GC21]